MLRLIRTERLSKGAEVGENVYALNGNLLVARGTLLTEKQIAHLLDLGVPEVSVVANRLQDLVEPALIHLSTKTRTESALTALFNRLQNGDSRPSMSALQEAAQQMVADIQELQPSFINFPYPQNSAHYLISHALHTGILAAGLGYLSGFHQHLPDITLGALLSDLGLMLLPRDLLDKPAPLDEAERARVGQHPSAAVKLLGSTGAYVKTIVYQHHERADGSGYPQHLSGQNVHPYAGLVGLADIYVALLADRPYRTAILPHSVLELVMSMAGWEFDRTLVQNFIRVLPPYPIGTLVHLSTGATGVVVGLADAIGRPTVRILTDAGGMDVEPRDISLAEKENQTIMIDKVLLD